MKDNESTGLATSCSSDKIIISTKDYQLVNLISKSKLSLPEAHAPQSESHLQNKMVNETTLYRALHAQLPEEMISPETSATISDIDSDLHEPFLEPLTAVAPLSLDNLKKLDSYWLNKSQ